ncbi:MAG: hypothetical protein APR53_08395 [Methanoculleus sp. SDB]|nr:MAG: hypothetical protein APR53_08395 [Methanoculleus sp. SDB]
MAYRWKNKVDVDEAVVVLMNSLDEEGGLADWLKRTIQQSINDSEAEHVRYFFAEIKKHAPASLKYFEDPLSSGSD